MARPAATPEQREEQRQRIRRAAVEVHAEKGLQGVSVRAIAQRAGVSTGTLYGYYANLQELMRSLWLEPVAEAMRELEAIAARHRRPLRRIRALLEGVAAFAAARPEVFQRAILSVRPEPLPADEVRPLDELPLHRLLRDAVREGQLRGEIRRGDPDELAQLLWAGLHGALALPVNADLFALRPAEELAPPMIRLLLRSIEAPDA